MEQQVKLDRIAEGYDWEDISNLLDGCGKPTPIPEGGSLYFDREEYDEHIGAEAAAEDVRRGLITHCPPETDGSPCFETYRVNQRVVDLVYPLGV